MAEVAADPQKGAAVAADSCSAHSGALAEPLCVSSCGWCLRLLPVGIFLLALAACHGTGCH